MDHLGHLESTSVYILREAYANFKNLCMLWSIGKDSTVMLWLARKAFLGRVPFPLVHIDTGYKVPEMIEYRDKLTRELGLNMIYGMNTDALEKKQTLPDGSVDTDSIEVVWVGRNPTNINYDVKASGVEAIDEEIDSIKKMLQNKGIIFKP